MPDWHKLKKLRYLAKLWDELTPELRRKNFVGDSFTSFKLWKKLSPKEIEGIKSKVHYAADASRITRALRKAGYMTGAKKLIVTVTATIHLDTTKRVDPKKLQRVMKKLSRSGDLMADLFNDIDDGFGSEYETTTKESTVEVKARK